MNKDKILNNEVLASKPDREYITVEKGIKISTTKNFKSVEKDFHLNKHMQKSVATTDEDDERVPYIMYGFIL